MKELEFKVKGMMCSGCENRVKNSLSQIDGVESVEASFQTGIVKIVAKEAVEANSIKEKIEDIGYEVQ